MKETTRNTYSSQKF